MTPQLGPVLARTRAHRRLQDRSVRQPKKPRCGRPTFGRPVSPWLPEQCHQVTKYAVAPGHCAAVVWTVAGRPGDCGGAKRTRAALLAARPRNKLATIDAQFRCTQSHGHATHCGAVKKHGNSNDPPVTIPAEGLSGACPDALHATGKTGNLQPTQQQQPKQHRKQLMPMLPRASTPPPACVPLLASLRVARAP